MCVKSLRENSNGEWLCEYCCGYWFVFGVGASNGLWKCITSFFALTGCGCSKWNAAVCNLASTK